MKVQLLNLEKISSRSVSRTAAYDSEIANWFCNEVNIKNPKYFTVTGSNPKTYDMVKTRISQRLSIKRLVTEKEWALLHNFRAKNSVIII